MRACIENVTSYKNGKSFLSLHDAIEILNLIEKYDIDIEVSHIIGNEKNAVNLIRGGDDGRIVTAAGRERREEAKENKREEADRYREAESARRDAWLNKPDHDFGGIRMSGHDLDKLINFYSANPEILGRLQSRLSKNNDPEKVKKGVKEFEEALALEKKKSQGKHLTRRASPIFRASEVARV